MSLVKNKVDHTINVSETSANVNAWIVHENTHTYILQMDIKMKHYRGFQLTKIQSFVSGDIGISKLKQKRKHGATFHTHTHTHTHRGK